MLVPTSRARFWRSMAVIWFRAFEPGAAPCAAALKLAVLAVQSTGVAARASIGDRHRPRSLMLSGKIFATRLGKRLDPFSGQTRQSQQQSYREVRSRRRHQPDRGTDQARQGDRQGVFG